jgi:hypothetical protein
VTKSSVECVRADDRNGDKASAWVAGPPGDCNRVEAVTAGRADEMI